MSMIKRPEFRPSINEPTIKELVRKVKKSRSKHIENWMRKCIRCAGAVPEDIIDACSGKSHQEVDIYLRLRGWDFKYRYQGPNNFESTEEHRYYLNDSQIGTTLYIKHDYQGKCVELKVWEKLYVDRACRGEEATS